MEQYATTPYLANIVKKDVRPSRIISSSATMAAPVEVKIEAETQAWFEAVIETKNSGFSGDAYINTDNVISSWMEYSIEVPQAGTYEVDFRFANGSSNRPANLVVNGTTQMNAASFPGTGGWSTWQTTSFTLNLNAGSNTLRLQSAGPDGGPNYDYISLFIEENSNLTPTISAPIPGFSVVEGSTENFNLDTVFSDPEGDNLSYSASSSNSAVTASISNNSLILSYTGAGIATITVTANDGTSSVTTSFDVDVASDNIVPELSTPMDDLQVDEGGSTSIDLNIHFNDADGTTLAYTVTSSEAGIVSASTTNNTLNLSYLSGGSSTVTVTADDGEATVSDTFLVAVEAQNIAPIVSNPIDDVSGTDEEFYSINLALHFSDPDGGNLSYSVTNSNPAVVSFTLAGATLDLNYLSPGNTTITVTANDGEASVTDTFVVTVNPFIPNTGPRVLSPLGSITLDEGNSTNIDISNTFIDDEGDNLSYSATSSNTSVATASVNGSQLSAVALNPGSTDITVTANDGEFSITNSFTLNVDEVFVNSPPTVINTIQDTTISIGDPMLIVDLDAIFNDADGHILTFDLSNPNNNIALQNDFQLVINPTQANTSSHTVNANDGNGGSVSTSFNLTILPSGGDFTLELQAEDQTWDASAIDSNHSGYTGIGFVNTDNILGTWVEFALAVPVDGEYNITVTYANGSTNRNQRISVNGNEAIASVDFDGTGAWANWADASFNLQLSTGDNAIRLTSLSSSGAGNFDKMNVTLVAADINNAPVVQNAIADIALDQGASTFIDISNTFADADGDSLSYSVNSSDTGVASATLSGTLLTVTTNGAGTATIAVIASDGEFSANQSFDIAVTPIAVNHTPVVASPLADVAMDEATNTTLNIASTFTDEDGDTLTYSVQSSNDSIVSVMLTGNDLTLIGGIAGVATITVSANDGEFSVSEAFNVDVNSVFVNSPPAVANTIANVVIDEASSTLIDFSQVFNDPDNDALSFSALSSDTSVASVTINGTDLTVTTGAAGTATITLSASDADFTVPTTFTVTAQTVVINNPPVAVPIADVAFFVGSTQTMHITSAFNDPDGDPLNYSVVSSDDSIVLTNLSAAPAAIDLTMVSEGTAVITLSASDGEFSASLTFNATANPVVVNMAPVVANPISNIALPQGDSTTVDLTNTFSDPDGDALVLDATSSDNGIAAVSIVGDSLDIVTNSTGDATITVSATDGEFTVNNTFTVTSQLVVINNPPVAVPIADVAFFVGSTQTLHITSAFNDPDGDPLTYSVVSSDDSIVLTNLSAAPAAIDLTMVSEGTAVITLSASDGEFSASLTFNATANPVVVNMAPVVANPISNIALPQGDSTTVDLTNTFSDPDGDALVLDATSSDNGITAVSVVGDSLSIVTNSAGDATITVSATDGEFTVNAGFTLSAIAQNQAPVVANPIADMEFLQDDASNLVDLSTVFTDPDGDALTFSVTPSVIGSPNAVLETSTGLRIDPIAQGISSYTLSANDGKGGIAELSFAVTVLSAGGDYSLEIEAESQTWDVATVDSNHSGYSGSGFVNTENSVGRWIELNLDAPATGAVTITITYASGSSNRPQRVDVNGATAVSSLDLDSTGGWSSWGTQSFTANLVAGSNAIRFTSLTSGGAPNVDKFLVEGSGGPTTNLAFDSRPISGSCLAGAPPNTNELELAAIWPGVSFSLPIGMVQMPGNNANDYFVAEKTGAIVRMSSDFTATSKSTFLDLSSVVDDEKEGGILSMAFDPDYPSQPYVYVAYTYSNGSVFTTRLSRFTSSNGTSANSEKVLFELPQNKKIHNAGTMAFGPDGFLYMAFGDDKRSTEVGTPNLFYGTVLRLDVHNDGPNGEPYSIPASNEFSNEVFAYGFRNPWRMSFDKGTGELWLGDVGEKCFEEINIVESGLNYGWPNWEADICGLGNCAGDNTLPEFQYHQGGGCGDGSSVTGGYVYRGIEIPELVGKYIFGDYQTGNVWAYDLATATNDSLFSEGQSIGLASWAEDNSGELFYIDIVTSQIKRLQYNQGSATNGPPATLAETGCFDQVTSPLVPVDGVVPYTVAQKFWSDGADKTRYLSIPDGTSFDIDADGDWDLPVGGVLIKHFEMEGEAFETRFILRYTDGSYGTYTYEWTSSTSAILVDEAGADRTLSNGQEWRFPSRNECTQCHTDRAGFTLGLETHQMNVDNYFPNTQRIANQLASLEAVDMISGNTLPTPSLPQLDDQSVPLHDRAMSYLHVNCSSCHRGTGGGQSEWDARIQIPYVNKGLCNVGPITPIIGVPDEAYIYPGDHMRSSVWWRTHIRGEGQMPTVGSYLVDQQGADLLADWINSMTLGECP